ncbi:hypothetical protein IT087_00345, partial [Candidatus Uhrbacteria bacterium]|nr:hypothetical protein [Candidatus Uhrbacteria bacterium]
MMGIGPLVGLQGSMQIIVEARRSTPPIESSEKIPVPSAFTLELVKSYHAGVRPVS